MIGMYIRSPCLPLLTVLLLLRRYSHKNGHLARDEDGPQSGCSRILKSFETYWIAFILFAAGGLAITITEFVGGETSITVVYASLVGCFFACLLLAYAVVEI